MKKRNKAKTRSEPSRSASSPASAGLEAAVVERRQPTTAPSSAIRLRSELRFAEPPPLPSAPVADSRPAALSPLFPPAHAEVLAHPTLDATLARSAEGEALALRYQQMYSAARVADSDGRIRLDEARFASSLANAGLGSLAEQELFTLALLAAADGHAALFEADVIAALRKAS